MQDYMQCSNFINYLNCIFSDKMSKSEQEFELFDPSSEYKNRKSTNTVGDIVGVSWEAFSRILSAIINVFYA